MIEIKNLTKKFEHLVAVDDLSFTVKEGEVLGFLGPNGAGKSTTMKVITGFLAPTSGSVSIDGHSIVSDSLEAKSLIGYLPEGAPSYGEMTTIEFLRFIARVRGFRGEEIEQKVARVIDEVALSGVIRQPIETLSKGFRRRVGLAQAIMHDPKALILDEPTDGLDPNQKHHVRELIRNLAQDRIVIISTHILEEVTAVCSRAIIIANGRIVADGTPAELESRSRYHQAVRIQLSAEHDLTADLADMASVGAVERVAGTEHAWTILAADGNSIFSELTTIARDRRWPVIGFHVERGQLEDVFRSVTQPTQQVQE